MDYIYLVIGMLLLIKGADIFVSHSSKLARFFKVSPLIIGLTIVAFGTSAPEAAISIIAAIKGNADLSLGNVIGSNMFNILFIFGLIVIIKPMKIEHTLLKREIPFMVLSSLLLVLFYFTSKQTITRIEGFILLSVFISFLFVLIRNQTAQEQTSNEVIKLNQIIVFIIVGILGIVLGGQMVTNSAVRIAVSLGMSELLIGLTIVAVGTSLPELATSLVAIIKKENAIAAGNLIGSNIMNGLFILGISSLIRPIKIQTNTLVDIVFLAVISLIFYLFSYTKRKISRFEGSLLFVVYLIYLIFIIIRN